MPGMSPKVLSGCYDCSSTMDQAVLATGPALLSRVGPVQAPLGQRLRMARPSVDMALYGLHAPASSSIYKGTFICSSKYCGTQRRGTGELSGSFWR